MAEQFTHEGLEIEEAFIASSFVQFHVEAPPSGEWIPMTESEARGRWESWLVAHDAQVIRNAGATFEYGDAVREADGTVWDHEGGREEPQSDAWLEKYNTEHREEMGDRYDGSQIVRLRRVRQGEWQVVDADRKEDQS